MSNLLLKTLLAAPAAGAAFAVSSVAVAAESAPSLNVSAEPIQLAQVTSVSELADVSPSDWAFQSLQSLVENYGCIQGYPDRTFRGNRSLTRYEFAAGLNACLDVMAVLISQSGVNPDDLAAIRRLQEEFRAELATLRGRVDALEAQTATLRAQQFSTTTKLRGQADATLIAPFNTVAAPGVEDSFTFEGRARLNFDSSFTGEDRLRIRLQAGSGGQALDGLGGLGNSGGAGYDVTVDDFFYRFPVGDRLTATLAARGMSNDNWVTSTIVPYDGPAVAGARTPQFYGTGGSSSNAVGGGVNFALTDSVVLDLGYSSRYGDAGDPAVGILDSSEQSVIAQLNFVPDGPFNAAVTYMLNNRSAIFTGGAIDKVNTFAGLASYDFGRVFVGGHIAYQTFTGGNDFSWTAGGGINDLFLEGTQLGVYGGQLPQLAANTGGNPWIVEGYYEMPLNQFLTITPALIAGDANIAGADSAGFWGVIRTTFRF
jgi:Carbohydrate-selective porin, OprB family/S-layer homology domain